MTVMNTVMLSELVPFFIRLNSTNSSLSLTLMLALPNSMHTIGDEVANEIKSDLIHCRIQHETVYA